MYRTTYRSRLTLLLAVFTLILTAAAGLANNNGEFEHERLVCEMRQGYNINYINGLYGTTVLNTILSTNAYLLQTQPGVDTESLADSHCA